MSKPSGKFGRRQVLQLGTEVKNKSSYGFGYNPPEPAAPGSSGALSGLVSQYGHSDEEDSDDSQDKVTAAPAKGSVVPMQAFVAASEPDPVNQIPDPGEGHMNGDSKQPKSILKKKERIKSILKSNKKEEPSSSNKEKSENEKTDKVPQDKNAVEDVDEKLKDFLAEIDALDHAPVDSEQCQPEDEDIDGEPMTPPTLEQFEQQEQDESEAGEEEEDPEPVKPIQPTTSWEHCLDEQTQYYYYWNIETNAVTWEIPEEFSQYLLQVKEYEIQQNKYEDAKREWDERQKNKPPDIRKKKKRNKAVSVTTQPPPPPPPDEKDEKNDQKNKIVTTPSFPPELQAPPPPPDSERKTTTKDSKKDNKKEHKKHHKKSNKDHQDECTASLPVIGPQPAPPALIGPQMPSKDAEDEVIGSLQDEAKPERETAELEKDKASEIKSESMDVSEEMDDDFIHKQLEEPVFSHYEYVNKKLEAPPPPTEQPYASKKEAATVKEEAFELDMEDIDKELEMALTRKKYGEVNKDSDEMKTGHSQKRSHAEVDHCQSAVVHQPKRPKTEPTNLQVSTDMMSIGRLHKEDLRVKLDCLAEASDLSNLVMDKLEFLDIQCSGLSDLQILLIELETRIEDWKRGGLNSDYLLIKLREADGHLQKYEENAAPPGWMCQWDRQVKKYYYFNSMTGESQWNYPLDYAEPVVQIEQNTQSAEQVGEKPEQVTESANEEEAEKNIVKNTFLDFAKLAEAPPPPPGEPPPPGTAPLPENGSGLLNVVGYEDKSETEDTSSDSDTLSTTSSSYSSSSESSRKHRKRRKDRRKEHHQKYDSCDQSYEEKNTAITSKEETLEQASSDPAIMLPVHSKPVHIAAQPVIMRPTPSVSPVSEKTDDDKNKEKPEQATISEPVAMETVGEVEEGNCGKVVSEEKTEEVVGEVTPGETNVVESSVPQKISSKEKKKKKDKSLSGGGLSMKKKGMSSMVEKWQKVQKDVEKGSKKPKAVPPVSEEDNK